MGEWEAGSFRARALLKKDESVLNSEWADMHYMYCVVDGNGRVAVQMYLEHFPNKRQRNLALFGQLHHRFHETGAF